MKRFILNNTAGKKVIGFFILANIVYLFMLLVTIPKVMSYSNGMKLPDMLPTGYNPEYINSLLGQLGQEGRNAPLPHDSTCIVWFFDKNPIPVRS